MKNVKVVVDVTGSCNLKDIEQQLGKIKSELAIKNISTEVSFFSFGERFSIDLNSLDLPIKNTENFFMGEDDFNAILKDKLKSNPDVLVFIGDCALAPIEKATTYKTEKTHLIFIQSRNNSMNNDTKIDTTLIKSFLSIVGHLSNVRMTNTEEFTSIEDILNKNSSIQKQINNLRISSSSSSSDSKLNPNG